MEPTPLPTGVDWRADISTRFWARLLDGFVLAVPIVVLFMLTVDDLEADRLETPLWLSAATLVMAAVYEIGFTAMTGQTIGKRLLRIQVVDVMTGRPPGLGGATIRYLVPAVPMLVPVVGRLISLAVYLSAIWSPTRQGWHDRASGTAVVRTAARQAITGGWADTSPSSSPPPSTQPPLT